MMDICYIYMRDVVSRVNESSCSLNIDVREHEVLVRAVCLGTVAAVQSRARPCLA